MYRLITGHNLQNFLRHLWPLQLKQGSLTLDQAIAKQEVHHALSIYARAASCGAHEPKNGCSGGSACTIHSVLESLLYTAPSC